MNCILPLLAQVKIPNNINICADTFKENLALLLQIVQSAGIAKLIQTVPDLKPYFSLPVSDDEDEKRRHEIVRLIVFGLICELNSDRLAEVYAIMCTETNLITLKSLSTA